jgi:hypothetical protein
VAHDVPVNASIGVLPVTHVHWDRNRAGALPAGMVCLLTDLSVASFVTWRGRWR